MSPLELLEENKSEIGLLCRHYGVVRLRVFGSALSEDWDEACSDIDFLADYGPERLLLPPLQRLVGLPMALEELLGRKVDVVNVAMIRNPFFKESAEMRTKDLYAA